MSPHWAWSIIEEWRWCLRWWSRDLLSRCIAGGWASVVYAKVKCKEWRNINDPNQVCACVELPVELWHINTYYITIRIVKIWIHLMFGHDVYPQIPPWPPAVAHHQIGRLQDWEKRPETCWWNDMGFQKTLIPSLFWNISTKNKQTNHILQAFWGYIMMVFPDHRKESFASKVIHSNTGHVSGSSRGMFSFRDRQVYRSCHRFGLPVFFLHPPKGHQRGFPQISAGKLRGAIRWIRWSVTCFSFSTFKSFVNILMYTYMYILYLYVYTMKYIYINMILSFTV